MSRTELNQRLIALLALGLLLFGYPLLSIFSKPVLPFGIPLLYLYLFTAWLVLIAAVGWLIERAPSGEDTVVAQQNE